MIKDTPKNEYIIFSKKLSTIGCYDGKAHSAMAEKPRSVIVRNCILRLRI